jgi:TPP-dependent pyruvate/acetoin dehydrogenase alpha subunit
LVKLSILFTLFTGISLESTVKGKKAVIITGIGIMIMGVIFHLQGQSIVGPETSFMYSNPQWVTYGIQIAIAGGIILAVGIGLSFSKKN